VCGEHKVIISGRMFPCGSSPRVWGTFINHLTRVVQRRFIPTCVGNIIEDTAQAVAMAVHPHVCGEHSYSSQQTSFFSGSSPRVWGTFCPQFLRLISRRFIPTCVGNMARKDTINTKLAVHPHVCGEHASARLFCRSLRWFIPTCVGNIKRAAAAAPVLPVHPHVCGEHAKAEVNSKVSLGSSPRVWGTCPAHPIARLP